jgi:hypothetical protein
MKILPTLAGAALAVGAAAPASAADTVVAATARATPVDAGAGHVLYSAWDGSAYRLTDGGSDALPVRGAAHPFRPDIGRDARDHAVAVYPRCTGDETGCDLYLYDFTTRRERKLRHADSPGDDEVTGAVWRDTLVFARVYHGTEGVLYKRSLAHPKRRSHRLAKQRAASVDLRGTRAALSDVREWSREPWLAWTSNGEVSRLTRVPGSGAAVDYLSAMNPTSWGSSVYWLLVRSGERDVSVLHRYNRTKHRDERVAAEIPRAASGFGYDAGTAYYAIPRQAGQIGCATGRDCPTDIHRVDGLTFEKAPPIELH